MNMDETEAEAPSDADTEDTSREDSSLESSLDHSRRHHNDAGESSPKISVVKNRKAGRGGKRLALDRESKWKRLRKLYNDDYLALLNAAAASDHDGGIPEEDLSVTQLGVVTWQAEEKAKLFNALSRHGRLDIPRIAQAVGSKSQLEVQDYLNFLRESDVERHLFEDHTRSISHADIPAAVEISKELDSALERAADALAMCQDQYDQAVAQIEHHDIWRIDSSVARELDVQADEDEEAASNEGNLNAVVSAYAGIPGDGLLKLSNFVELAERLYMNGPPDLNGNWREFACKDEYPAITYAAVCDLHDLTVSITRRLMQTSLFLAESRIRSTKYPSYLPKPLVKDRDVIGALDVLKFKQTSREYWIKLARRNQLQVISGTHDKMGHSREILSYDEVERLLRENPFRRSRSRSSSVGTNTSSHRDASDSEFEPDELLDVEQSGDSEAMLPKSSKASNSPRDNMSNNDSSEEVASVMEDSDTAKFAGLSFHASTSVQKRRQIYLEYQQDAYMEDVDRLANQQEEKRLWQMLGGEPPTVIKDEHENDLGMRPQVLRKMRDDLEDWRGAYRAEWEATPSLVLEDSFQDRGRPHKRRKVMAESDGLGVLTSVPFRGRSNAAKPTVEEAPGTYVSRSNQHTADAVEPPPNSIDLIHGTDPRSDEELVDEFSMADS